MLFRSPLELPAKNGRVANLLTLRYREGPRELMAYVMIMDAGSHFVTATITQPATASEFNPYLNGPQPNDNRIFGGFTQEARNQLIDLVGKIDGPTWAASWPMPKELFRNTPLRSVT